MSDPTFDRAQVLDLLGEMSRRASRRNVRLELFLVGGAAMVLAYGTNRTTRDIDGIFEPKMIAYEIAAEVARDRGLPAGWLNDAVKAFPFPKGGMDPAAKVYYDHPGLVVRVASPRYLFAMKAWSGREADEEDLRALWPLCKYASAAEALDEIKASYPTGAIKVKTQYLVEELAEQLSHGPRPSPSLGHADKVWVEPHQRGGRSVAGHWRRPPGGSG